MPDTGESKEAADSQPAEERRAAGGRDGKGYVHRQSKSFPASFRHEAERYISYETGRDDDLLPFGQTEDYRGMCYHARSFDGLTC